MNFELYMLNFYYLLNLTWVKIFGSLSFLLIKELIKFSKIIFFSVDSFEDLNHK